MHRDFPTTGILSESIYPAFEPGRWKILRHLRVGVLNSNLMVQTEKLKFVFRPG